MPCLSMIPERLARQPYGKNCIVRTMIQTLSDCAKQLSTVRMTSLNSAGYFRKQARFSEITAEFARHSNVEMLRARLHTPYDECAFLSVIPERFDGMSNICISIDYLHSVFLFDYFIAISYA